MRQVIKDFYGKIIGYLEDKGDRIQATDFYGKILGWYNKKQDTTVDFYGRILGRGDLTSGLIWQEANKK